MILDKLAKKALKSERIKAMFSIEFSYLDIAFVMIYSAVSIVIFYELRGVSLLYSGFLICLSARIWFSFANKVDVLIRGEWSDKE